MKRIQKFNQIDDLKLSKQDIEDILLPLSDSGNWEVGIRDCLIVSERKIIYGAEFNLVTYEIDKSFLNIYPEFKWYVNAIEIFIGSSNKLDDYCKEIYINGDFSRSLNDFEKLIDEIKTNIAEYSNNLNKYKKALDDVEFFLKELNRRLKNNYKILTQKDLYQVSVPEKQGDLSVLIYIVNKSQPRLPLAYYET